MKQALAVYNRLPRTKSQSGNGLFQLRPMWGIITPTPGTGGQSIREAMAKGRLVLAGPDSPEEAVCPSCGAVVKKRKRQNMDGQVTYFYRHETGVGEECSLRYHP
jgi:hypothetical protein